jgi:hypothetical protein
VLISEIVLDALDGVGVRWWTHEVCGAPLATAFRNRLEYHADIAAIRPDVVDAAEAVHRELVRNADADLRHYITHQRPNAFGPLEPIPGRA